MDTKIVPSSEPLKAPWKLMEFSEQMLNGRVSGSEPRVWGVCVRWGQVVGESQTSHLAPWSVL